VASTYWNSERRHETASSLAPRGYLLVAQPRALRVPNTGPNFCDSCQPTMSTPDLEVTDTASARACAIESWLNSFIVTTPISWRRSIVRPGMVFGFAPRGGSSRSSPDANAAVPAWASPSPSLA
jgi:hypothetical protein